jgi:hypothetical protein
MGRFPFPVDGITYAEGEAMPSLVDVDQLSGQTLHTEKGGPSNSLAQKFGRLYKYIIIFKDY